MKKIEQKKCSSCKKTITLPHICCWVCDNNLCEVCRIGFCLTISNSRAGSCKKCVTTILDVGKKGATVRFKGSPGWNGYDLAYIQLGDKLLFRYSDSPGKDSEYNTPYPFTYTPEYLAVIHTVLTYLHK